MPFREDGTVHRVGLFCRLIGGMGPDGMAVDRAGNLAVAHAGGGQVWLWSTAGLPTHRAVACDGGALTTNVAYGGLEGRTLFITNLAQRECACGGDAGAGRADVRAGLTAAHGKTEAEQ